MLPTVTGYQVSIWPIEPWPQSLGVGTIEEGGQAYSETGDFYTVEVLKGG